MIKTKIVTIPAKPEKKVKKELYICDLCNKESIYLDNFRQCHLCKRLICRDYTSKCSSIDRHEDGDYPNIFCQICWNLKFKKYEQKFINIKNDYETKLEDLENKIKNESLNTKI